MLQVPSASQFGSIYLFVAPYENNSIGRIFASVFVPTADIDLARLNGMPVDAQNFIDKDGNYSNGTHSINTRDNILKTTGDNMGTVLCIYGSTPADVSGNGIANGVGMTLHN